jgi:hypothetical protein
MTITIHVADPLANRLQRWATLRRLTPEQLALDILADALEPKEARNETPDTVVARIRSTPASDATLRPAKGSLREALELSPGDPAFDLAQWTMDWNAVEQEMTMTSRSNALAEGLG